MRNRQSKFFLSTRQMALMILAGTSLLCSQRATAQSVDIQGGPDQSGHNYTWTITNNSDIPITEVIIPHFRGDLFAPVPQGWKHEATQIPGKTSTGKAGVCHFSSTNPALYSVDKGKNIQFHMRIAPKGAPKGLGVVTVIFKDGSQVQIDGVKVAVPESWISQNSPFVGMVVCFIIFVLFMARKSNANKRTQAQEPDTQ